MLLLLLLAVILHGSWDGLPGVYVDAGVVGLTKFLRTRKPIGDTPSSWWPAKPGPSLSARAKREDNLSTGKGQKTKGDEASIAIGQIALGQRRKSVPKRDEDGSSSDVKNTKFPTGMHNPPKPPFSLLPLS